MFVVFTRSSIFPFFSGRTSPSKIYLCGMTCWNSSFDTSVIWVWISIKFPTKWYVACPYFEKFIFWSPGIMAQNGCHLLFNMVSKWPLIRICHEPFFWPLDDIFTLFKVKPNPLKYAHSTYTRSKRNFQFDNTHHLILWVLSVFLEFL